MNSINSSNRLAAGFIAFVVAIADEIHQVYIPGRDASITDVLLDVVGIIFCLFLIQRMEHRSGFSKIAGFLRRIS
jgi:VanZ family protein